MRHYDSREGSDLFLNRREAAVLARVGISTIDRGIRDGEIPHKRIRRRVLIPKRQFIDWCNRTDGGNSSDAFGNAA